MSMKNFNVKALDIILEKMVETVGESKHSIFDIEEQCRQDFEFLTKELEDIKIRVQFVIAENDRLDEQSRFSRRKLSEVSKQFNKFSEEQVRETYENAHKLQVDLQVNRQLEKQLRKRRDDLELQLKRLQHTIERAAHLGSQITVVLNYLTKDLKHVGEALEEAKLKQEFGLKIIEAQEQERKKLSREIHDGPAQMLANVMMRADLVELVQREKGPEAAIVEIRSLKAMVRSALYEVRRIIYDLRPMALDDLGIIPTLKKYLSTIEEYHKNVQIDFINLGPVKRLPNDLEVALFRLVQEALQNALKHAAAKQIQVKLSIAKEMVTVVIKDNGKGFDPAVKKEGSFGLMGMKERVDLLEGELSITSSLNAGTLVMIQVPLTK